MKQKYSFYTNSLKYFANGNGFIDATVLHRDYRTFIRLYPLFVSLCNSDTYFYSVSYIDIRHI